MYWILFSGSVCFVFVVFFWYNDVWSASLWMRCIGKDTVWGAHLYVWGALVSMRCLVWRSYIVHWYEVHLLVYNAVESWDEVHCNALVMREVNWFIWGALVCMRCLGIPTSHIISFCWRRCAVARIFSSSSWAELSWAFWMSNTRCLVCWMRTLSMTFCFIQNVTSICIRLHYCLIVDICCLMSNFVV